MSTYLLIFSVSFAVMQSMSRIIDALHFQNFRCSEHLFLAPSHSLLLLAHHGDKAAHEDNHGDPNKDGYGNHAGLLLVFVLMLRKLTFFNRALHSLCLFNPSPVDFWVDWANLLGAGFRGCPAHGAGEDGLEFIEAGAILLDEAEASQSASIVVVVAVEAGQFAALKEWLPVLVLECVPVATCRRDFNNRLLGSLESNSLDS